jgi:hypothetical protein
MTVVARVMNPNVSVATNLFLNKRLFGAIFWRILLLVRLKLVHWDVVSIKIVFIIMLLMLLWSLNIRKNHLSLLIMIDDKLFSFLFLIYSEFHCILLCH